jgi:hypothetical protein
MSPKNVEKLVEANRIGPMSEQLAITTRHLEKDCLIDDSYKAMFAIAMVYKAGAINTDSYVSNLKNVRDGKFLRTVGTYMSPVDKSWHNEERMLDIWVDHAKKYGAPLHFSSFIAAMKLCDFDCDAKEKTVSKNNNYHVGRFFLKVLVPMYEQFASHPTHRSLDLLRQAGVPVADFIEDDVDKSTYCCEDCDGPLSGYDIGAKLGKNKSMAKDAMDEVAGWLDAVRYINRGMYDGPEITYLINEIKDK